MLSVQHVNVSRGSKLVLRDVSFDAEPKDIVCVLGEEGSGKSTLLKLLTRERTADDGVVKIDGANLAHVPREVLRMYRQRIGYLSEDPRLDPTLTIAQNIALPLTLRYTPAAERTRAVTDLLKRLRLTDVATEFPGRVSRGERQLTALAMAIAQGPVIVLLDEPFQGIGDETAGIAAKMLQNMCKKGSTIILATAEERTARLFPDARILRLERGKLTEETRNAPRDSHMRALSQAATAGLVERSTTEHTQQDEPTGKRKIRITAVGSL